MTKCCRKCRGPLPEGSEIGRPASYCSLGCRRAAEFELRRIQTRLQRLEDEEQRCRLDRTGLSFLDGTTPAQHAADLAQEIERAEVRLRELLAAAAPEPEPEPIGGHP